jgi:hypothetical protein
LRFRMVYLINFVLTIFYMRKFLSVSIVLAVVFLSACNTRKQTCPAYSKHPAANSVVKA